MAATFANPTSSITSHSVSRRRPRSRRRRARPTRERDSAARTRGTRDGRAAVDEDGAAAHAGGPGVDRDHAALVVRRGHQRFRRLDALGRFPPPAVRLVGAGRARGVSVADDVVSAPDVSVPCFAARRASFNRVRW
jgi:hypothetical protein